MTWLPRGYRAETSVEVKRSRFVTTLARVDDEGSARSVIAEVRRRFPDARHHCSAFIVEVPGAQAVERSSDDGEPAGTAGMPMLDALRGAGVSQVVAVVTRYFGGVLLGTGGLVRAYTDAVTGALDAAVRVEPVTLAVYEVELTHADAGRVQDDLIRRGAEVLDASYGPGVRLRFAAPDGLDAASLLAQLTQGAAVAEPVGSVVSERPLPPPPVE